MEARVESIGPSKAKHYLALNTRNRPLRKSLVLTYARTMSNGRWRLTHQGIAFNINGELLDGQHRLAAIIESGETVEMMVTRGVESEDQIVMDDHAKRSAGDALSLIRGEKITARQVGVVRACIELTPRGLKTETRMTKQELDLIWDTFIEPLDFVQRKLPNKSKGVESAPVRAAVCMAWFYVADLDRLDWFCEVLTGRELPVGDSDRAAVVAREWLLRAHVRFHAVRSEAYLKTQRAIYGFMEYEPMTKLYGGSIYYPWPLQNNVRGEEIQCQDDDPRTKANAASVKRQN